jgi:hypothetical protein
VVDGTYSSIETILQDEARQRQRLIVTKAAKVTKEIDEVDEDEDEVEKEDEDTSVELQF